MTTPTSTLASHVHARIRESRAHAAASELSLAWASLELAHVLSQPDALLHTLVHWEMLLLALRVRDAREVFGQLVRLAGGGLGSALGRFPAGNSGRARVSAFVPMPIPEEAQRIFESLGLDIRGTTMWRGRRTDGARA